MTSTFSMTAFAETVNVLQQPDYSSYDTVTKPKDLTVNNVKKKTMLTAVAPDNTPKQVLLIQDVLPWNSDANEQVLNQIGLSYSTVTIETAATLTLQNYKLIIIANDQEDSFYRQLSSLRTTLEKYVINGGTLIYGVCDSGWSDGMSDLLISGDVKLQPVAYRYNNYINDPKNPIVTDILSEKDPLTNSDLYNNYCSHRCFDKSSLPYDADIIFYANDITEPTLVQYPIGSGTVIASGLTWEHCWQYQHGAFGRKALDDLFLYGYSLATNATADSNTASLGTDDIDNGSSYAAGDPINVATGNFMIRKNDISISGKNPISFSRFYNAMDNWQGALGNNWYDNFEVKLKNMSSRRVRISFEDGHTEDFIYGDDGVWFSTPGKYSKINTSADGAFSLTKTDGTSYIFDVTGNLSSIQYLNGNTTTLTYDDQGKLSKADSGNGYFTFEYDGNLITKVSDSAGRSISYTYTGNNLASFTNVEGSTWTYTYDSNNRITKVTDPLGNVNIVNAYDDNGRVTQQTMPDSTKNIFSYDDSNLTTTYTEKNGTQVIYKRDSNNRVYEKDYINGSQKMVFNDNNQITTYTDKNGNTYNYEYDNNGNVTKETDPLGNVTGYTFDPNNKVTSITNPDGSVYTYTYDSKGNVISATDPLGRTVSMEYNNSGLPVKLIQSNSAFTTIQYDNNGNPTVITDADGNTTTYSYDSLNRVKTITKPLGNKIEYDYTVSGKIKKVTYPNES